MKLYRFEVEYKGERMGLFNIPEKLIHQDPASDDSVNLILKFYAIFEDKLTAPDYRLMMNSISFFTEKGYRKFKKQIKLCRNTVNKSGKAEWVEIVIPKPELTPVYEDHNQIIYNRTALQRYCKRFGLVEL